MDLVTFTLPEISPNYKPLPHVNSINRREEFKPVDDIIYVKNQRYEHLYAKTIKCLKIFSSEKLFYSLKFPEQKYTLVINLQHDMVQRCPPCTNCVSEY